MRNKKGDTLFKLAVIIILVFPALSTAAPNSTFNFQIFDDSSAPVFNGNGGGNKDGQIINVIIPPTIDDQAAFIESIPKIGEANFIERVFEDIRSLFQGAGSNNQEEKNDDPRNEREEGQEVVSPEINNDNNIVPAKEVLPSSNEPILKATDTISKVVASVLSPVVEIFKTLINIFISVF